MIKHQRLREEIQEKEDKTRHNGKTVKTCERKKLNEREKNNDNVRTALTPGKKQKTNANKTKTK